MRTRIFSSYIIFTLIAACGSEEPTDSAPKKRCATTQSELAPQDGGFTVSGSGKRGLLLTTTQDYKSSRLFFFDFASAKISQLLAGESGDPGLFSSKGEVFFFNRAAENSNLRSLNVSEGSFELGVQTAMPGAGSGDPHAVLHLDDRYLLMSFWAGNSLGIFDLEECTLTQKVELPFDVGAEAGQVFRPSSLFSTAPGEVYVVHQGLAADGFTLTGRQQIFSLAWNGATLSANDLDPAQDKIQGIPLKVSNPTGVFQTAAGTTLIAGSCTIFGGAGCKSGFEAVDLAARTTDLVWDMSDLAEKHNGAIIMADDSTFYAQLVKPDAGGSLDTAEKLVGRLDFAAKTLTKVHTYPQESFGCCGLFYDETSKHLIVTDHTATAGGSVIVMDQNGSVTATVGVENTPYTGLIIPQ